MVGRELVAANEQGFDDSNRGPVCSLLPSFDVSFWRSLPLFYGGTLVLPDNEVRQSVEALTDLIATQNVTHRSCLLRWQVDANGLSFEPSYACCCVERPVRPISSPALPVVCG